MHGIECFECEHRKANIVCKWCRAFELFEPLDESLNFNDEDERPSQDEDEE